MAAQKPASLVASLPPGSLVVAIEGYNPPPRSDAVELSFKVGDVITFLQAENGTVFIIHCFGTNVLKGANGPLWQIVLPRSTYLTHGSVNLVTKDTH
mgnify:CR=1 FL=1